MNLLKSLQSLTKWKLIFWGMVIVMLGVTVITAIWLGRDFSFKTNKVNISVSPANQPLPHVETLGPGSPVVTGEDASVHVRVTSKSPPQQEKQKSNADIMTHGAGSPVVIGKGTSATVTVDER